MNSILWDETVLTAHGSVREKHLKDGSSVYVSEEKNIFKVYDSDLIVSYKGSNEDLALKAVRHLMAKHSRRIKVS